ncbi:hypothetical protein CPC08DRAFT_712536 [Agrocybe pediades]|nr:hypothetical protein CPC08DRAFT_712536 [Agrocybe pediades]
MRHAFWSVFGRKTQYKAAVKVVSSSTTNASFLKEVPATASLAKFTPVDVKETCLNKKELLWATGNFTFQPVEIKETFITRKRIAGTNALSNFTYYKPAGVYKAPAMKNIIFRNGLPASYLAKLKSVEVSETSAAEETSSAEPSTPLSSTPNVHNVEAKPAEAEAVQAKLEQEEREGGQGEADEVIDELAGSFSAIDLSDRMGCLADALSAINLGSVEGNEADSEAMEIVEEFIRVPKRKALDLGNNSSPEELHTTRFTKSVKHYQNSCVATGLANFIRAESMLPYRCLGDFRLRKGRSAADQAVQERRRNAALRVKRAAKVRAALLNEIEMGEDSEDAGEAMELDSCH